MIPPLTTYRIFRIFDFGVLRWGQFGNLAIPHYLWVRQWGKTVPFYTHQMQLLYYELRYIKLLLVIQVQILIGDLHSGDLESPKVTSKFLLIMPVQKSQKHGHGLMVLFFSQRIE